MLYPALPCSTPPFLHQASHFILSKDRVFAGEYKFTLTVKNFYGLSDEISWVVNIDTSPTTVSMEKSVAGERVFAEDVLYLTPEITGSCNTNSNSNSNSSNQIVWELPKNPHLQLRATDHLPIDWSAHQDVVLPAGSFTFSSMQRTTYEFGLREGTGTDTGTESGSGSGSGSAAFQIDDLLMVSIMGGNRKVTGKAGRCF